MEPDHAVVRNEPSREGAEHAGPGIDARPIELRSLNPTLTHTFADELPELVMHWQAAAVAEPRTVLVNVSLAEELGLDADWLRTDAGARFLAGTEVPEGAMPVAMAYAGHQFGGYSPRLGDGRALLLGELADAGGLDLHLKGSGRTPFARGGDGKAALGPMLREFVIAEAMHALGIPTTRSLAVVATGEPVAREALLPGAVLARVAASHIRVGTFQYAAALGGESLVQRLADHAMRRHHPAALDAPNPYVAFYEAVVQAQAELIARWMQVGFIHGVMNTDNMTISGETIDYGPCAFMDAHHPSTVFSSIDHGGRYAYGNQPTIGQWNLARLAETLLPLFAATEEEAIEVATEVLVSFTARYDAAWRQGMRAKLALPEHLDAVMADALVDDLLAAMQAQRLDHTGTFRSLASLVGGGVSTLPGEWLTRWRAAATDGRPAADVAQQLRAANPLYVPRNHMVEAALTAATNGDLSLIGPLLQAVAHPFDEQPGLEAYAEPDPEGGRGFRTFCGT